MDKQRRPKKITSIVYGCLYFVAVLPVLAGWIHDLNEDIVLIHAEIDSHMSNFTISFVIYLGIGYRLLLQKREWKRIAFLGVCILIANVVCETLMGFMNTTDIVDAIYGITAVLISYCFFFLANTYGFESSA